MDGHAEIASDEVAEERPDEELDAERAVRRRYALAQIRQYPDAALRLRAQPVERFDEDLGRLAARLAILMRDANGVGLAATQVGILQRVFVFQLESGEEDEPGEIHAVVNPELLERSEELESADEGCLSLQGVLTPVERPVAVTLAGRDPEGAEVRLELRGLSARVAQHELDHLDGILILERTTPEGRREALATLRPQPVLPSLR